MARKAPFRPRTDNGITQNFNDGEITIYRTEDRAQPGYYPQIELSKKVKLRYEKRSFGFQRYYAAAQNLIEVKRVVRVPQHPDVTNQDVAQTEDGTYYRIDHVQDVVDVYPPSMDLTLAKYTQGATE